MLPFNEFLKNTQILTMLYSKQVGRSYYERNVVNYYDFKKDALLELTSDAMIDTTTTNTSV